MKLPPSNGQRVTPINFEQINRAALPALPAICRRWLPSGCVRSDEYIALNPCRADRHAGSFRINLRSGKWADFACDARGGDVVSLIAYLEGVQQTEAARLLAGILGMTGEHR